MRLVHTDGASFVKGPPRVFSVSTVDTVVPSSQTGVTFDTVQDAIFENIPSVLEDNVFDVFTDTTGETLENLTPSVSNLSSNSVTWISSGIAKIKVTKDDESRIVTKMIKQTLTEASYSNLDDFVAGSLMKHTQEQFNTRLAGKLKSDDTTLLTTEASWSVSPNTLVRNSSLWCSNLDLSGIAVATSTMRSGAGAISPRHILSATHHKPSEVSFIDTNGAVVTRTVSSWQAVLNGTGTPTPTAESDLSVGYLSADLPATVAPLKVLPANYIDYLPNIVDEGFPIMYSNDGRVGTSTYKGEARCLHVGDMGLNDYYLLLSAHELTMRQSQWSERVSWWWPYWTSGTPLMTIINDEVIFLAAFHTNLPSGVFVSNLFDDVNSAMADLHGSTAYQLQPIDLSSFPTYT